MSRCVHLLVTLASLLLLLAGCNSEQEVPMVKISGTPQSICSAMLASYFAEPTISDLMKQYMLNSIGGPQGYMQSCIAKQSR